MKTALLLRSRVAINRESISSSCILINFGAATVPPNYIIQLANLVCTCSTAKWHPSPLTRLRYICSCSSWTSRGLQFDAAPRQLHNQMGYCLNWLPSVCQIALDDDAHPVTPPANVTETRMQMETGSFCKRHPWDTKHVCFAFGAFEIKSAMKSPPRHRKVNGKTDRAKEIALPKRWAGKLKPYLAQHNPGLQVNTECQWLHNPNVHLGLPGIVSKLEDLISWNVAEKTPIA